MPELSEKFVVIQRDPKVFAAKIFLGFSFFCMVGWPVTVEWKALMLFAGIFCVILGTFQARPFALGALAALLLIQQVGLRVWPFPQIEVGENILLLRPIPTPMEAVWPKEIQAKWKDQFLQTYLAKVDLSQQAWQNRPIPSEDFSFHPESFWREAKYSRAVRSWSFHGLNELGGGFVNQDTNNFWEGNLQRKTMPFWVMLEWGPHTAGGSLWWQGEALQADLTGAVRRVFHPEYSGQILRPEDQGTRWYFAFFPEAWAGFRGEDPNFQGKGEETYRSLRANSAYPRMEFRPSLWAGLGSWIEDGLALAFFVLMVTRVTPVQGSRIVAPLVLAATAYVVIKTMMHYDWGKNLLALYPPHRGGDDGLIHESLGLGIVRDLKEGNLAGALAGGEPVFYFTPGLRYFRALEKIFFGATNLGYTLGLMLLPAALWGVLKNWLSPRLALGVCTVFLLLPPNLNFSFSSYVTLGRLGYPEPLATLVFLGALWILFLPDPRPGAGKQALWFLSGFLLFLGIFLRPNHAIPAGVTALAAIGLAWRQGDRVALACFFAGLGFFVLLPLHNVVLGGKFAWITSSVSIALPIPWATYPRAVGELLQGGPGEACHFALERIRLIFTEPTLLFPSWFSPYTWIGLVARSLALGMTLWVVGRGSRGGEDRLFWLALIALANFPFLLVMHYPNPRYIALGWDLCFCTTLIWIFCRLRIRFHGDRESA